MLTKLKVRTHFDAAHYLPKYPGKCANLHGHTYQVEVEVSGEVQQNGMFIDFAVLKEEVKKVIEQLDHQLINYVIDEIPTAENIAKWVKFQLLKSEKLKKYDIKELTVTIYEGLNNSATV